MDGDPWGWTVRDVARFFHHHAQNTIRDLPNSRLPPSQSFSAVLTKNEVDGVTLLTGVETGFLREDCGIQQLGVRTAVIHCIRRLQARSAGYTAFNKPAALQTPITAGVDSPPTALPLAATSATSGVGENARAGETQVQDERGHKRRRLDLSGSAVEARPGPEQTADTANSDEHDEEDDERYIPRRKVPVDEVFFGDTNLGKELVPSPPKHPAFIDGDPEDPESTNLEFISITTHESVAGYVYTQMRRFLSAKDETFIQRHNRDAFIQYPYRVHLPAGRVTNSDGSVTSAVHYNRRGTIKFGGERSALVVRAASSKGPTADGSLIATREPEGLLTNGAVLDGYTVEQAADLLRGDFAYLLDKYPANSSELGSLKDKDDDSASILTDINGSSDTGSQLADDQAVEDDDDELSTEDVNTTIDEAIAAFCEKWASIALPKLEAKEAWKTWKKTKKSKHIRDGLIEQAEAVVAQLEGRLRRFREDIVAQQWESREAVRHQCEVLEVTVADREKEQWKIGVWQRRQEPSHVIRPSAARKQPRGIVHPGRANDMQKVLRRLGSEDRLSLSPIAGADQPPPFSSNDDDVGNEAGRERYYTPEGPSPPRRRSSSSSFVVDDADEADESNQEGESPDGFSADKRTSRAPRSILVTPSSKLRDPKYERASQMLSPSAESPTMPSFENRPKSQPAAQVVDLTGYSTSTQEKISVKKRKKRRTKAEMQAAKVAAVSNDPEHATAASVDLWKYHDLAEQSDRLRLLIKLFRDIGPAMRHGIHESFQLLLMSRFLDQLTFALIRLQGDKQGSQRLDASKQDFLLCCARMACAWYLLRPDLMKAKTLADVEDLPGRVQLMQFTSQLRGFMQKKESTLFVNHKATSASAPLEVSSTDERAAAPRVQEEEEDDDDDDDDDEDLSDIDGPAQGSGKQRRKPVLSQTAADQREAGKARMARHKDLQSQSSNAMQLQSMLPAESSHSAIEINIGRPEGSDPIYAHPDIAKKMKAHQAEGVQFMWREITAEGSMGSILAHTMGLGKTMQAITLLVGVDEASRSTHASVYSQLPKRLQLGEQRHQRQLRFLILCPPMLLSNWRREIEQWAPAKAFREIYTITTTRPKAGENHFATTLEQWSRRGGLLCIGYSILRGLLDRKCEETEKDPEMWNSVDRILMDETEMVVADEAHNFKNAKSVLYRVVQSIKSESRIALTGTPMSNDVDEIFALVSWVAPGYLGDLKEFNGRFAIPIKEGLYADSTQYAKRQSLKKLRVLHSEIAPKINRADITVLKGVLKSKTEFILTVELTERQRKAYSRYVNAITGEGRNAEASQVAIFAWLAVIQLLLNHQYCYREKLLTPVPPKKKAKQELELPDDGSAPDDGGISPARSAEDEVADVSVDDQNLYSLGLTKDIIDDLVADLDDSIDIALSVKASLLGRVLQLSQQCGDNILVFTTSIPTLNYLDKLLKAQKISHGRIDGSIPMARRSEIIANFQAHKCSVLLISTKAGGTGINVTSANRVVIFDSGFNPTWEEQAIGRSYRLGQKKAVYVYRFVVGGTFEDNLYNRQLFKTSLASRVVDKKNPQRNAKRNTLEWLYEPKPVKQEDLQQWKGKDTAVLDRIIDAQSRRTERDESIHIRSIKTLEVLTAEETEALTEIEQLEVEQELQYNMSNRRGRITDPLAANGFAPVPSTAPAYLAAAPAAPGVRPSPTMSRLQRPVVATAPQPSTPRAQSGANDLPARDIRNQNQMAGGAVRPATQVPRGQPEGSARYLGGLPSVPRR